MLEDTIELLTKQMIEEKFNNEEVILKINKIDLYKFCIKLVKLIKQIDELEVGNGKENKNRNI